MKRNASLIVLIFEIAAIVVLHVVKMNQVQGISANITKTKILAPVVKSYTLLSIK